MKTDLVVVIPVGPNCKLQYITDTINSLNDHATHRHPIILIDDSQKGTGRALSDLFPSQVTPLVMPKNKGKNGGLYSSLCQAMSYALDHFDFKYLLRLDTDALVIGNNPVSDAISYFEAHPDAGMGGSYLSRRYTPDCFGNIQDNAYPRNTLLTGTCTLKFLKRPLVNWTLRKLLFRAFQHGYELGENIQGGAYIITRNCIERLRLNGLLPSPVLCRSVLMEDHLFSMLTRVVGLRLVDLGRTDGPFGCVWKGLPAAPEQLLLAGKKIIHSVRQWKSLDEHEIRLYFKNQRSLQSRL